MIVPADLAGGPLATNNKVRLSRTKSVPLLNLD